MIREQVSFYGISIVNANSEQVLLYRSSPAYSEKSTYIILDHFDSDSPPPSPKDLKITNESHYLDYLNMQCLHGQQLKTIYRGNVSFSDIINLCYQPQFTLTDPREYIYAAKDNSYSAIKLKEVLNILIDNEKKDVLHNKRLLNDLKREKNILKHKGQLVRHLRNETLLKYKNIFQALDKEDILDVDFESFIYARDSSIQINLEMAKNKIDELLNSVEISLVKQNNDLERILINTNSIDNINKLISMYFAEQNSKVMMLKKLSQLQGIMKGATTLNEANKLLDDLREQYKVVQKKEINILRNEIYEKESFDTNQIQEKVNKLLQFYLRTIGIELQKGNIFFDISNGNLYYLDEASKKHDVQIAGSSVEWVIYHISLFLSLHEMFVKNTIIQIPNFLIIDSPSKLFNKETNTKITINKIYSAFKKAIERTNKKLQIIILDDYDERNTDFTRLETWNQAKPLIPLEWI